MLAIAVTNVGVAPTKSNAASTPRPPVSARIRSTWSSPAPTVTAPPHAHGIRAPTGQMWQGLLDRVIRGQTRIAQRSGSHRVGIAQRNEVMRRHRHVLGHTTVPAQTHCQIGHGRDVLTIGLQPGDALAALTPADGAVSQVGGADLDTLAHTRTQLLDPPGVLVTKDERRFLRTRVPFLENLVDADVGVARAGSGHPQEYLPRLRPRLGDLG